MIEYKQYVIVPKHPKMSAGKIASQVAHATFMALDDQRKVMEIHSSGSDGVTHAVYHEPTYPGLELINKWRDNGMCVIVLECETQEDLFGITKYCEQWGIPHHLYIDEGLTECKPLSPTAFATGVLTEEQWWPFEKFKLYNDKRKWFK